MITAKPTPEFVQGIIAAFYKLPGNIVGGSLHIVTDDFNIEDRHVQFCLEYATKRGDANGMFLAELLLSLTEEERSQIVGYDKGY